MELIGWLIIFLALGLGVGSWQERRHFRALYDREYRTHHVPATTLSASALLPDATEVHLVVGAVVISSDYFKTVVGGLLNLVGGRITVFETLLERGRREAVLRMKEAAIAWGATHVVNVRIETSSVSGTDGRGIVAIEVIAYGTGIR